MRFSTIAHDRRICCDDRRATGKWGEISQRALPCVRARIGQISFRGVECCEVPDVLFSAPARLAGWCMTGPDLPGEPCQHHTLWMFALNLTGTAD